MRHHIHRERRRFAVPSALSVTLLVILAIAAVPPATAEGPLSVNGYRSNTSAISEHVAAELPATPDYHSLLVNPSDPEELVLGTHYGLYVSTDGGRHWRFDALNGSDAMNLARPPGDTIWLAGHMVFKKSTDGGSTWKNVRPRGLPSLDIHGFAVDPRKPDTLYAAMAGQGLYRSKDAGRSFSLASRSVGGNVMALLVMPDGRILAGDMLRGLLESRDGGKTWKREVRAQILGLAVNPTDPKRVLATTRASPSRPTAATPGGSYSTCRKELAPSHGHAATPGSPTQSD
jgi:hypothetical protein